MDKEIIAQRLKTLRESARLSQAKMARELGIMQPLITKYKLLPFILKNAVYRKEIAVRIDDNAFFPDAIPALAKALLRTIFPSAFSLRNILNI